MKVNASEFKLTEIVNNLVQPWSLTFVDNSNVLITEKYGSIIQINLATAEKKEIKHEIRIKRLYKRTINGKKRKKYYT